MFQAALIACGGFFGSIKQSVRLRKEIPIKEDIGIAPDAVGEFMHTFL